MTDDVPAIPTPDLDTLYATTDASVWASEFVKVHPLADEADMIGWFANAIETAKRIAIEQHILPEFPPCPEISLDQFVESTGILSLDPEPFVHFPAPGGAVLGVQPSQVAAVYHLVPTSPDAEPSCRVYMAGAHDGFEVRVSGDVAEQLVLEAGGGEA